MKISLYRKIAYIYTQGFHDILIDIFRHSSFFWDPSTLYCKTATLSPNSYKEYDPKSSALKLYTNEQMKSCGFPLFFALPITGCY